MTKIERLLQGLILLALFYKIMTWPGGSFYMVLALPLLAVLYLIFGFLIFNRIGFRQLFKKKPLKKLTSKRVLGAALCGCSFCILCMGILFGALHWPGGRSMLISGIITTIIVLIIGIYKYKTTTKKRYRTVISRGIFYVGLGLFIYISPMGLDKMAYRDHPNVILAIENYENNPNSDNFKVIMIEKDRIELTEEEFIERYQKNNP